MNQLRINSAGERSLLLMGGTMDDIRGLLPQKGLFIITDTNVSRLWGHLFPPGEVLVIEAGEKSKTLETAGDLCRRMLLAGADRSSFILGFGGGVVCDVAGLTASLFMRGVRHAFVSTSLLSQVDASIGGKTGVNLGDYKNIIGTFRHPEFVLCDYAMLSTLPETEFRSGLGEVYKHAAIRDRNLFLDLAASSEGLAARDPGAMGDIILRAVKIKAAIVRRDPLEHGIRKVLNFGHTFGHVLETQYSLPHGIAVAQGMILAAELSVWKGEMQHSELRILQSALEKAGLLPEMLLPANIVTRIARDKKGESGSVNFVLLRSVGRAIIRKLPLTEIQGFVNYFIDR
ncbi:MAG: 3-dehydroquinate synthase family protein [Bacteroidales bacterium]|jgi:3-dehydroquinate synthase|nr:3-dehydroquinate synthase family protein [Bacteroidales bacterium]